MIKLDNAKILVLLVALICATVLVALGKIDVAVWSGLAGSLGGYGLGNGVTVAMGKRPTTLVSRRDIRTRAGDTVPVVDLRQVQMPASPPLEDPTP